MKWKWDERRDGWLDGWLVGKIRRNRRKKILHDKCKLRICLVFMVHSVVLNRKTTVSLISIYTNINFSFFFRSIPIPSHSILILFLFCYFHFNTQSSKPILLHVWYIHSLSLNESRNSNWWPDFPFQFKARYFSLSS